MGLSQLRKLKNPATIKNIRNLDAVKKELKALKEGKVVHESWNGFANISKANADEIAEAATKIKNHRTSNNLKGSTIILFVF